ncbi:MAG: hypothetical protein NC434_08405 [Ruminococcus sp.]|nr:hypothetical protein [Ruminococcus sp.]
MQGTMSRKQLMTKHLKTGRNSERNYFQKKPHFFWIKRFGWIGRRKVHRQIKDRLFRFLFEKDKGALLQLYNALNGTFSDLSCRGVSKTGRAGGREHLWG